MPASPPEKPYEDPFPAWLMRGGQWLFNATSRFYTGVNLFDPEPLATSPVPRCQPPPPPPSREPYKDPMPAWLASGGEWLLNATSWLYTREYLTVPMPPTQPKPWRQREAAALAERQRQGAAADAAVASATAQ